MFHLAIHPGNGSVRLCVESAQDAVFSFQAGEWKPQRSPAAEVSDLALFTDFLREKGYVVDALPSLEALRTGLERLKAEHELAQADQGDTAHALLAQWARLENHP